MKIKTEIIKTKNENPWVDSEEAKRNPGIYEKKESPYFRYISVDGKLFCIGDINDFYESSCFDSDSIYRKVDERIVVEFG